MQYLIFIIYMDQFYFFPFNKWKMFTCFLFNYVRKKKIMICEQIYSEMLAQVNNNMDISVKDMLKYHNRFLKFF